MRKFQPSTLSASFPPFRGLPRGRPVGTYRARARSAARALRTSGAIRVRWTGASSPDAREAAWWARQ